MKKYILVIVTLLMAAAGKGQFVMGGKIEYERKVNVHAQMEEMEDNEWYQKIKASLPKFTSTYFDMVFDTGRSLYKPGREVEGTFKMFGGGPATENIVYTDLTAKKVTACKTIYEKKFLVTDSMRKTDWKEKEEIRTIAGFQCHKAVSIICDSVYVVAFYSEEIPVSGGPEMFGGLPGMILELAVPRLHTTWVATKVDRIFPQETDFVKPDKGKKVTQKEMLDGLQVSFKDWGKMAPRNMWWTEL